MFFVGSPPAQNLQCYGVLLPFRKSPVTTAGASRAARKTERWESLTGGYLGFHGLKAGVHAPLQASGPRHASRATPSRGLASHSPSRGTSLCCSESLAAPAERHREERPPGCPKAVDAYTFVETTPPAHRRASQCTVP